jgi:hypothetical protein
VGGASAQFIISFFILQEENIFEHFISGENRPSPSVGFPHVRRDEKNDAKV